MAARKSDRGPTLADVARIAGCSPISASRALNTPDMVSPDLRQRVAKAVAEIGYRPNLNARALASIRTNVVGVLVPSLTQHIFTDVLRGIYDGLQPTKLRVLLGNTHYDDAEEERLVGEFLGQKPSAMIVSGIEQRPATRKMLEQFDQPVIQIMDLTDDPIDRIVGFSHFQAGYLATRHLIEQGYRHIGFGAGWVNQRSSGRMKGWRRALEEAGIFNPDLAAVSIVQSTRPEDVPVAPTNKHLGESTSALNGRKYLCDLLEREPRLDAMFCNNDILALGVLFEAHARGIAVPEGLGIVGFNDTEVVSASHPSLTSVRTPRYEIGLRAVQEIIKVLEGRDGGERVMDLGVQVMVRASTMKLETLAGQEM
ncbi:LacI family DNA-binding transcriptional regulator [Frigidibacter sp. ROC022]|uniref:LacI family DNA-binding transcriptional regulator n=1 Tax=Frigidibacter sp. ROC022 TaxID=2971796 RepID=UPI00215A809F|nr:LacI family DNA-binding transcriptional regulator [Frigidibacter sp. ROC022]MCR8724603.1 LacI family DNA-binding transcriptional regulator [Frigidibacter sp. ROC022]